MREYLEAGKIVATHGVRGEMKLELWCDGAEFLAGFKTLYFSETGAAPRAVGSVRPHKGMALLTLAGVGSIEEARPFLGRVVYIARSEARLPAGRYFLQDLIGLAVRDSDTGRVYGRVTDVTHPAAQDIYTVLTPSGEECRFPGVPEFLKGLYPAQGYLLVAPIPGMFSAAENADAPQSAPAAKSKKPPKGKKAAQNGSAPKSGDAAKNDGAPKNGDAPESGGAPQGAGAADGKTAPESGDAPV